MKKKCMLALMLSAIALSSFAQDNNSFPVKLFTESFTQDSCKFFSKGRNAFFILEPGYRCTYEGFDDMDTVRLVITVLKATKKIGGVETRVVEEHESLNGRTVEISRNFFALCQQTGNVFYFGEEVDIYKDGRISSHEGAWVAEGKNKAGIAMPGSIMIGARYYQEIAPGVALDRAEIVNDNEKVTTSVGTFTNCVKIEETTPLEPQSKEYKIYAPGIGLVKDGELYLIEYGFIK